MLNIILSGMAAVLLSLSPAFASDPAARVTFHFYGAEDCPPCMAFKRDGLPVVEASASAAGYAVADNMIRRTADVGTPGAFGEADPILRRAGQQMSYVYPPIFFVTLNGEVHSLHAFDWRAAMRSAEAAARETTN